MRTHLRQAIPSGAKARPITAKGPQECMPLKPDEFCAATLYVARAFLSDATLPKDFFSGVPLSSSLAQQSSQRMLLAAYAHFRQDGNRALSFYFRYRALLQLLAVADISKWVTFKDGCEYAVFTADILSLAARHPMLASGQFDQAAFIAQLEALEGANLVEQPQSVGVAEEVPERLVA